ncbi:hypothetical protein HELRODRAFT_81201 [Helobdella robusta]|uniref:Neurotransmitter-gated ion-channel ligand-binding domain-containing protein n=1 Tax=Helobdella robusta TaxID=6412 RepID=T1G4B1_HELRO|nr:hypothetical protein HELRODRAFT_81201 [Helobdella robusta]ESO02874.1 hypothetical protein HELRODRAFT_81201 [Helobdella robusta]
MIHIFHVILKIYLILWISFNVTRSNPYAKKLYDQLIRKKGYSKVIRPVYNTSDKVIVEISLKLSQLIDLDERNQIMTTNVWVTQTWFDPALVWKPKEFGNVDMIYVPANSIWVPDIVLYNTADGVYEMTSGTKAVVMNTGKIKWKPPASFRSSCLIDVTYFPFDEQMCGFQFGSWTYNIQEVDIQHAWQPDDSIDMGIDLSEFYRSAEWDLMSAPATKRNRSYAGSEEPFPEWTFNVTLKRKFLFYTVNLILPLMSHAFITVLVFYIPAASTEKMSLSINILLSLTVFFLMLVEIIPPTSLVVPLLGKYLLFTLMLVSSSVIITVLTYNIHYRSFATHCLPHWVRKVFLYWLPRCLFMKRPEIENHEDVYLKHIILCTCFKNKSHDVNSLQTSRFGSNIKKLVEQFNKDSHFISTSNLSPSVQDAVRGALYIANHLKRQDEFSRVFRRQRYPTIEDWKYMALVIDRIFLWIYSLVCLSGTLIIICQAPMLYDTRVPVIFS